MKISIFSLFRDSEKHLKRLFGQLEEVERQTNAELEYFFYENDSVDNTPKLLKEWISSRNGKVLSEELGSRKFGSTLDTERMILLSNARNKMKNLGSSTDSAFSLIFDSDIIFNGSLINNFLKYKDLDFSMLTANVRQDVPCKMGSGQSCSYYDSSILFDTEGNNCMTWSNNPFYEENDRENFENNNPVEVLRAFGSAAFCSTNALKKCQWNSRGESEHWSFCDKMRDHGKIFLLPGVKVYVNISQKNWEHEGSVIEYQQNMLESPWNRFIVKASRNNQ